MLHLVGDQAKPPQAARKAGAGETIDVQVLTSQSIHRVLVNSSSSQTDWFIFSHSEIFLSKQNSAWEWIGAFTNYTTQGAEQLA